jgi:hypothetical protein
MKNVKLEITIPGFHHSLYTIHGLPAIHHILFTIHAFLPREAFHELHRYREKMETEEI